MGGNGVEGTVSTWGEALYKASTVTLETQQGHLACPLQLLLGVTAEDYGH